MGGTLLNATHWASRGVVVVRGQETSSQVI